MTRTYLRFNSVIGSKKPESIVNRETACPFCDREKLTGILASQGSILLVKNKFPVLEDTFPTVLIETDQCDLELSTYSKEHLYQLIRFGVGQWLEMEKSGEYSSVMFFKNHGPYSGGSIHHPHMQIIGLHHVDCLEHIRQDDFRGITIDVQPGMECTISTKPRVGFYEFNIVLSDQSQINRLADYIQMLVDYILHHFHWSCNSYNLFFYHIGEQIMVKVVPRFVTSPLYVGYAIPQVANNLEEVARAIQRRYLID